MNGPSARPARAYPGRVPFPSRLRGPLVAAAVAASLGCSEPEHPSYTRIHGGTVPSVERTGPVLVVFWATWCPPCREELPGLRALARDPPALISLVTFGEDHEEAAVREFFRGAPPAELGYRPDVDRRAAEALGVDVLPAAFLVVDAQLVARFDGPRDWNSRGMRRLLTKLASESPPPAAGPGPSVDPPRGAR